MSWMFVMITSDDCIHCKNFKKHYLDSLIQKIQVHNNITSILINFKNKESIINLKKFDTLTKDQQKNLITVHTMAEQTPVTFNKKVIPMTIGWVPKFMLFPMHLWNDNNNNLTGFVANGNFVNGLPTWSDGKVNSSDDSIYNWIISVIKKKTSFVAPSKIKYRHIVGYKHSDDTM